MENNRAYITRKIGAYVSKNVYQNEFHAITQLLRQRIFDCEKNANNNNKNYFYA